jgi:hypothetical protein
MGHVLGMNAKIYYGDAEIGTPVDDAAVLAVNWTVMGNARDVTLDLSTAEADITARDNDGWRATVATLKEGSVEFEMRWDPTNAGFTAIKTAYFTNVLISLLVLDGADDVAGNQGLAANFSITDFSRTEPLEDAIGVSVTAKPTSAQYWYTVGGS